MEIKFKKYSSKLGFSHEFDKVRKFLVEVNKDKMNNTNFLWARWEWTMSLMHFGGESPENNGLWYDGERIVALASNEVTKAEAYLITLAGYEFLKTEMLTYAKEAFRKEEKFRVLIADKDYLLQKEALKQGFVASQDWDKTSAIDISDELTYDLPNGFEIHSLADGYDLYKLDRCTYRGFDNGDEPPAELHEGYKGYQGPNFDKSHFMYVQAPNGDYAAYCGTWYDKNTDYAYVEPVCTDPLYRKMGFAKAVVFEAVKRCGILGAKTAYVLSSQQFYYNIGFYPVETYTWWYEK
ncbi:MAG TPA: GNAT family N-acetyltransferase [Clostridium sp.]